MGESGLEVAAAELERSYNGLTSLKKRKKLAPADIRGKVVNLRKDLEVIRSDPELFGNAPKKLKAARIPLTGRDWEPLLSRADPPVALGISTCEGRPQARGTG